MKKFSIEAAGTDGIGRSFIINPLSKLQYQIFNDQKQRLATIELDDQDPGHCRQSLDCRIDLPLLNAIRERIHYRVRRLVK
jgi:hypothetical protein